MYEKVNRFHPDKVADRIAGALVDYAYSQQENPKIAVEVLIGHGKCHIIAETSVEIPEDVAAGIVKRIAGDKIEMILDQVPQDVHLAGNQKGKLRCGDNGIFKGVPVTEEQAYLKDIAKAISEVYPTDGKYILDGDRLIICQSNASNDALEKFAKTLDGINEVAINPLGEWTGGPDVDSGATNRKLGSDMADSVTGGGLCLSGDSEYIGEDLKWHRMDEYNGGKVGQWNDGVLEFVEPLRYIRNESDDMMYIHNDSKLSMKLTPYHEMLIQTSKGNLIKHPAGEIAEKLENGDGNSGFILHNFKYDTNTRKSKYKTENEYRLQVAFCADGTLLDNRNWSGRIRVKKECKKERMRMLLNGIPYKESADGEFSIFWFNPPVKSKSLYECFSDESLDILVDEVFKWDGDEEIKVFRTTHKEDADFVQFAIASFGRVATITENDRRGEPHGEYTRKSICYTVHELQSVTTGLRKTKDSFIKVERSSGEPSYCFTVPSHNLVIRHNNRIFITGNCGKDLSKADVSVNIYCFLMAQHFNKPYIASCAIGDESVNGVPYEDIVRIAKKYIDGIGGFEKFAEWGLIR